MKTIIKKKLLEECLSQCREFVDKPNLLTQTCFRLSLLHPISHFSRQHARIHSVIVKLRLG